MMPERMQLDRSERVWIKKKGGISGYSSEDGQFDILQGVGFVVLVSFIHEAPEGESFWSKRFTTTREAMVYAEMS